MRLTFLILLLILSGATCNIIMKIVAVGPYVGDFSNEIFNFRPYVKWLSKVLEYDLFYICTHFNRMFLYDWIPQNRIKIINESLTRNEISQFRSIHTSLKQKDFQLMTKDFILDIVNENKCKIKDVKHYNLSYIKSQYQIPMHKKIFSKVSFNYNINNEHKNRIVFIPEKRNTKTVVNGIYKKLISMNLNPLIIGDMKCRLKEHNELLKYKDYYEKSYQYIIECIKKAKSVICANGHWAMLANLYNIPLYTWGATPAQYKNDGLYNFGNKICMSVPFEKKGPIEGLTKTMEYFIRRKVNEI